MEKFVLLFLCVLVAYANAGEITQCEFPNGQVLKVGEEQPEKGNCNILKCHENGNISILTCPEIHIEPPCVRVIGDQTKDYPRCCDIPICPMAKK